MHISISSKSAAIDAICQRYGVKTLEVFGSAARGGDFVPELSDADFLVEFNRPAVKGPLDEYFGLKEELAALLGREVDLVEYGALKNPFVMEDINKTRELVYAS